MLCEANLRKKRWRCKDTRTTRQTYTCRKRLVLKTTSCLLPFASRRLSSLLCFPCLWPIGRSPTLDRIVTRQKLLLHLLHLLPVATERKHLVTNIFFFTNRLFFLQLKTKQLSTSSVKKLKKKVQMQCFAISTCGLKRIFCVIN